MEAGDILFFEGLGHVGLYLGRGRMVHAPQTGRNVEVVRLASDELRRAAHRRAPRRELTPETQTSQDGAYFRFRPTSSSPVSSNSLRFRLRSGSSSAASRDLGLTALDRQMFLATVTGDAASAEAAGSIVAARLPSPVISCPVSA